jgi:hypothetical protein
LLTDQEPSFLTAFVPDQTHNRFQGLLLPDLGVALPAVAWLEDQVLKALPRLFPFPIEVASTGLLSTDTQQLVPAALLAQFDQFHPG